VASKLHLSDKLKKMSKTSVYLKESYTELTKKVSWPTWAQLTNSAGVVMVASVILAAVIFLMDISFRNIMTSIYQLF